MTKIEVKGIVKVTAKGRTYWYAWRGGPRLHGEPGSREFLTTYNEAIEKRRIPEPGRFRSLVTLYRASADFKKLAVSTKRNWGPWLDRIADYFGDLSIAQSGIIASRRYRLLPVVSTTSLIPRHTRRGIKGKFRRKAGG
jgi:hypothetical protein